MKKIVLILFLLVIITPPHIYGQMGKSFFPQISFFDQYVNYIHSTAWPGSGSILNQVDTVYRRMKELGITHSVTMANSYSLNPVLNRGIKLLDRHLEWSSFLRINNTDAGGVFLKAQGQDSLLYPFQVGGLV